MSPMHIDFADFSIDTTALELRRAGKQIPLRPKPFKLLRYLIQHRGRIVSRDELLRCVWEARTLSPSTVPTAINAVRTALSDDPESPRFIETVPQAGYRFIGKVRYPLDPRLIPPHTPFVGRDAELSALESAYAKASLGHVRLVLVSGDPGIGKTRLVQQFSLEVSHHGTPVLFGRCRDRVDTPPFWPWVQVLETGAARTSISRSSVRDDDTPLNYSADVSVPSKIYEKSPSPSDRFQRLEAIARDLREMASRDPLILILDDLHQADIPSLLVADYVLRELVDAPILLVCTYRDAELDAHVERASAISALAQVPETQSLPLRGLSRPAIKHFLSEVGVGRSDAGLSDALYTRTAGNPFFVGQLLNLIENSESAEPTFNLDAQLPTSIRATLTRQIERLPAETASILRNGCVLGTEFSVPIVSAMTRKPAEECLAAVEPAVRARLVTSPAGPADFAFAHELLRDVIYESLSALERQRLHLAAGHAIETALKPLPPRFSAELAHHFSRGGDTERLVLYSERAASWCEANLAFEDATVHLRTALESLERRRGEPEPQQVSLLQRLGEAELRAGRRREAKHALQRAARLARELDDAPALAKAALALAPDLLSIEAGVIDPVLIDLLEDALSRLAKGEQALRAAVMARLSLGLAWSGSRRARIGFAEQATVLARHSRNPRAMCQSLVALHGTLWEPTRLGERLSLIEELQETANRARLTEFCLMSSLFRVTAFLEQGLVGELDYEIERFAALLRRQRQPQATWYIDLFRAMRALMRGEFAGAATLAESFFAKGRRFADANVLNSYGAHVVLQMWNDDRVEDALALVHKFVSRFPRFDAWKAVKAYLQNFSLQRDEARAEYRRLTADGFDQLIMNENWRFSLCILAELAVDFADRESVARLYDLLRPGAGSLVPIGHAVACWGPQDRQLAILCEASGNPRDADRYFEGAIELCERTAALPWMAQTLADYGEALSSRPHSAFHRKGQETIERALELATELGMKRLVRSCSRPRSHSQPAAP